MATSQTNEDSFGCVSDALIERYLEAFATTNSDLRLHDPEKGMHGVEALGEHERTLYETCPDLGYPPVEVCFDSRCAINVFSLVQRMDEHREFGVAVFR